MSKIAFLFPGQGSQKVGMGEDFYQADGDARALFDQAAEITGVDVAKLCFQGPMAELTQTINLQPAITVVNLAIYNAIARAGVQCDITAGHSVGEYSALYASGFISSLDTLKLVLRRGELMDREATRQSGVMHAIIGLTIDKVQDIVNSVRSEGIVSVANHNTGSQIVITGAPEPVSSVSAAAEAQGARAIPLKVSGAWHSALIQGAEAEFSSFLKDVSFTLPQIPIVHNVTADLSDDAAQTQTIMARQLCRPVKWYDSMRRLVEEDVTTFVEVGPGKVLSGLLKKILPREFEAKIYNVNSLKTLEQLIYDLA